MKVVSAVAFMVVLGTFLSGGEGRSEPQSPCAPDIAAFCKDVVPGEGRLAACLKEHEKELTPVCREHLIRAENRVKKPKRRQVMISMHRNSRGENTL